MNATIDRLITAARDLIYKGGSVTRREALRDALEMVRFDTKMPEVIGKQWQFTPASEWVLTRAAKIASDDNDEWIRIAHLEQALKELPPTA